MKRTCPRCHEPLVARSSSGVEVDLCDQCGGVYLDEGEFDRLIADRFLDSRQESMFSLIAAPVDDPLPCSGCGHAMDRADFDEVELDRCPECGGIWLDGHERRAFAERATESGRAVEPEATVACEGCGTVVPQRLCIRRFDAFWCEDCVVAGNHPGPEAQLVGTKDLVAGAARSFATAKVEQDQRKFDQARRKRMAEMSRSRRSRGRVTDPLFVDTVETLSRKVLGLFRRRE